MTIDPADIVAIGITNQRETTIVWDSVTGEPLYNAIGKIVINVIFFINCICNVIYMICQFW